MISVVIRPFKSGGVFYPAGTIVDPAGIKLYKSRIGEGKIKVVDEHNLEEVARFLTIRHKMEDAQTLLADKLAYKKKVIVAANKLGVDMTGKTIEQVVAEVKAKQAADAPKTTSEKK